MAPVNKLFAEQGELNTYRQPHTYQYDRLYRPPNSYPSPYPQPYNPGRCPGCGQCQTCGRPVQRPYVAPWRQPTVTWSINTSDNKSDIKLP